jgi:BMFP domain-containing protein YqiC
MSDERRIFDDFARVASGAAGAFGDLRARFEGEIHDQIERLLGRMNLVKREDHEVVAALAQKARAEQEILAERVAAIEAKLGMTAKPAPVKKAATARPAVKAARKTAKPKTARKPRSGVKS